MGIITNNGVNLPTLAQNTIENTAKYSELTGEFDVSASSAGGELIAISSEMSTLFKQDIADAVSSNQIENANGTNLDFLATIKNQSRKVEQQSVAYIEFTNTSGSPITVAKDTLFTSSENDEDWTLDYDVIVPASGTAYGSITSVNNSISASANTISPNSPIINITATNNSSAYVGDESESDADLRERLLNVGTPFSYNLKVGLKLALLELDNVISVNILDNNTLSTIIDVPPKSFATVIVGGNRAEIAKVIHTYTGCGSLSYGNISQLVKAEDGSIYNVSFQEPTELLTVVNATLTTNSEFDSNSGKEQVRELIVDYFESLAIGDDLFIQLIESVCLIDGVTNVVLTLNGGSVSLFANYNERFVTNSANVTVTN